MIFCDSHFHAADCKLLPDNEINKCYAGVSCAHSTDEWDVQTKLTNGRQNFFNAFGLHPQLPRIDNYRLLEQLLQKKKDYCNRRNGF